MSNRWKILAAVTLVSVLITVVVGAGLTVILQRQFETYMVSQELEQARERIEKGLQVGLSSVRVDGMIIRQCNGRLPQLQQSAFDRFIKDNLLTGSIERVDIWSVNGVQCYSSAEYYSGALAPEVQRALAAAQTGGVSRVEIPASATQGRILRIFVPYAVSRQEGRWGVVEFWHDMRMLDARLPDLRRTIMVSVGASVAILYAILVLIVWTASRTIIRQQVAVRVTGQRVRDLEDVQRMKDEFFSVITHELRTPLTVIKGYTELLRDPQMRVPEQMQAEAVEIVDRNATRMAGLVDDLLDVMKLQQGRLQMQIATVDAGMLVARVCGSFAGEARSRGMRLEVLPPEAGTDGCWLVQADQRRCEQVLYNLVSNALKYSPDGTQVRVVLSRSPGRIRIAVQDEGVGISADDLNKLFDKFVTITNERSSAVKSSGLGLYIAKALVEAQGGEISVQSTPGAGSTFTISLPATQDAAMQVSVP